MMCLSDSVVATFVQGLATADEIKAVEAHVAECPDCRGLVAQMAELGAPPPDPGRTILDSDDAVTRAHVVPRPSLSPSPSPSGTTSVTVRVRLPDRVLGVRWLAAGLLLSAALALGIWSGHARRVAREEAASSLAAARAAIAAGDGARARAAVAIVLDDTRDDAALADAHRLESAAWLLSHDRDRAVAAANASEAAARRASDPLRALDAALARALAEAGGGQLDAAHDTLVDVLARARRLHHVQRQLLALTDLAALARHRGRVVEAERWTAQAAALSRAP